MNAINGINGIKAAQVSEGKQASQPLRVLIVDDMPQVRQDLRLILPLAGKEAGIPIQVVGEAGDGLQAIQQARDLMPDLVLMDLVMPGLDGLEATRAIKTENPSMRVVILTVHTGVKAGEKAFLAGADGFFEKGAPLMELLQLLVFRQS